MEINAAVAATEREITDDVFSDEPLELDGDTSLEDMGDDIDDDLDEDEAEPDEDADEDEGDEDDEGEGEPEALDPDADEAEGDEGDGEGDADGDDGQQPLAARGLFVPRGRVTQEAARRRSAEDRARDLEAEVLEQRGQLAALTEVVSGRRQSAEQRTPEPAEPQPMPDPVTDFPAWQAWYAEDQKRSRAEMLQEATRAARQANQQELAARADEVLGREAAGPRRNEFRAAYGALTSLPKTPENGQLAMRILHAPNAATALWDWWDANGREDYLAEAAEVLAETLGTDVDSIRALQAQQDRDRGGRRELRQQQDRRGQRDVQPSREQLSNGQPRHVVRGARPMRSLNDVGGGHRQQMDPRTIDDSDASVAAYAISP